MLWDRCNNVLYVGGRPDAGELADLLRNEVHPSAQHEGRPYLRGRGMDNQATGTMEQVLGPYGPVRGRWRLSAYIAPAVDLARYSQVPSHEEVCVVPIDRQLLHVARPAGTDGVVEEITQMWPSLAAFEERGFGCAAVQNDTVVCWCTTEYMSKDRCGIGIWTAPEMRRKGIAALTAAHCVAEGLRRRVTLHWDCAVRNVPSVKLAEKLGFELLEESELLHWKLP